MSNALAILDTAPPGLPANLTTFFEENTNIPPKDTVPSLSFKGKVWTISVGGDKQPLMRKDQDGELVPINVFKAIVLDWAKKRGRAYYESGYDPDKPAMPACWSDDGMAPDDSVKEKQASKCSGCPMSVKGSKVTDSGKGVAACSEHRLIVVVPASKPDFEPLRLKIAITSDWDGLSPDHQAAGWFGFSNYTDMLRAKQVSHTAMLVTKIKFDPNVTYPKLLFSPDKWVDANVLQDLIPVINSDSVKSLLNSTWTPNGSDDEPTTKQPDPDEEDGIVPTPAPVKATPKAAAAPAPAKVTPKAAAAPAPAKAAPKAAAVPAAKAKPSPAAVIEDEEEDVEATPVAAVEDDDEDGIVVPQAASAKAAPKAAAKAPAPAGKAKAAPAAPGGLDELLGEWSE